jgi:large subunit ribosomal protein L1
MPNPKDGTVTADVVEAVKNAKAGQVRYRADKGGVVHCPVGKLDFETADLCENVGSVLLALKKVKPVSAKGVYFKRVTLSTTMGPGLQIDISGMVA